jgi:hypothetical protein
MGSACGINQGKGLSSLGKLIPCFDERLPEPGFMNKFSAAQGKNALQSPTSTRKGFTV